MNIFQRRTPLNEVWARRRFYSANMIYEERALAYINRVRQLASDLRNMEVTVADDDMVMSVLCWLFENFESQIVAIDTLTDNKSLSLKVVFSKKNNV